MEGTEAPCDTGGVARSNEGKPGESSYIKRVSSSTMMPPDRLTKLSKSLNDVKTSGKPCGNTNCPKRCQELIEVPPQALVYFGMKNNQREFFKVCETCLKKALLFLDNSKKIIRNKENLFSLKTQPQQAIVELEACDVEVKSKKSKRPEQGNGDGPRTRAFTVNESRLTKEICGIMQKLNLSAQITKCEQSAIDEAKDLGDEFRQMGKDMESVEETISSACSTLNKLSRNRKDIALEFADGTCQVTESDLIQEVKKEGLPSNELRNLARRNEANPKDDDEIQEVWSNISPKKVPKPSSHTDSNSGITAPKRDDETLVYPIFSPPSINEMVYVMNNGIINNWDLAKVLSVSESLTTTYQVQLWNRKTNSKIEGGVRTRSGKHVAFSVPLKNTDLTVGTRVIAKFNDLIGNNPLLHGLYYAAVILEEKSKLNKNRYLVYYDDGYCQYVGKRDAMPIVRPSDNIWEDVHANAKDFIREYIQFPRRKFPENYVGQEISVFCMEGVWAPARVVEIDCSIIKVQFTNSKKEYEWIFRGSSRLDNSLATPQSGKKSTSVVNYEDVGIIGKISIPLDRPIPRGFIAHVCNPSCAHKYVEETLRNISPLTVPFYLGWARVFGKDGKCVSYITPCGLQLATYESIHTYNSNTQTWIPIEFFSLESQIDCLSVFKPTHKVEYTKDFSKGKEWTQIETINAFNKKLPDSIQYSSVRTLGRRVDINFEDGFLVCCDCTDDCKDKTKCQCWKLTMEGISFRSNKPSSHLGYENRRLYERVESGIYECNRNCKCNDKTCLNRVAQNKIKWPLQLFMTSKKGWGVRALHDMPKGSFICIYSGRLLTDEEATKDGLIYGDEYIADLDLIEVLENYAKEGYEVDCQLSGDEERPKETSQTETQNNDRFEEKYKPFPQIAKKSSAGRSRRARSIMDKQYAKKSSGTKETSGSKEKSNSGLSKPISYRKYFSSKEGPYGVDGKRVGNIGRYLNHSCDPNVFIQSVFVDTQDLRFPWVAFFTSTDVKAGTELCWDYRYEKGSVPGKTLYCECQSSICRKRLL